MHTCVCTIEHFLLRCINYSSNRERLVWKTRHISGLANINLMDLLCYEGVANLCVIILYADHIKELLFFIGSMGRLGGYSVDSS